MDTQENIALIRRAINEIFNEGNLQAADELFADNYIWHPGDGISEPTDREGHKRDYIRLRTAMPDLHLTVEDMVADGDKVVTRFTITGTQTGDFKLADDQIVKPTNHQLVWTGITIHRIQNGKVVEAYINYDKARMDRQLGMEIKAPVA